MGFGPRIFVYRLEVFCVGTIEDNLKAMPGPFGFQPLYRLRYRLEDRKSVV